MEQYDLAIWHQYLGQNFSTLHTRQIDLGEASWEKEDKRKGLRNA